MTLKIFQGAWKITCEKCDVMFCPDDKLFFTATKNRSELLPITPH
jgi:hypothetical protein